MDTQTQAQNYDISKWLSQMSQINGMTKKQIKDMQMLALEKQIRELHEKTHHKKKHSTTVSELLRRRKLD